jgi:uncharacterized membrane protein YozB (DUF420 family)
VIFIHPILQAIATLIGLYVAWLGFSRFRGRHLGVSVGFNWKGHVRFGIVAMAVWFMGLLGGLGVVWMNTGKVLVTGLHYKVALAMLPLMAFGLWSGLVMDRKKKNGTLLSLAHGLCNLVLLLLALFQGGTGFWVLNRILS